MKTSFSGDLIKKLLLIGIVSSSANLQNLRFRGSRLVIGVPNGMYNVKALSRAKSVKVFPENNNVMGAVTGNQLDLPQTMSDFPEM